MNIQYRKKPVVIEAFQWTDGRQLRFEERELLNLKSESFSNDPHIPAWFWRGLDKAKEEKGSIHLKQFDNIYRLIINTLEGFHEVTPNDWIIKGIKGELYPCKPDIFQATYEEVK